MNRKMLIKLAISGFVLGAGTAGCASAGSAATEPARTADADAAAKQADKARSALEKGKAAKAVALAEAAVAGSPRDAGYRTLLGQAYLNDGRFVSASTALTEAMELGATDSNTVIALTLAYIAQGKNAEAVELLRAHDDTVPASDAGLALALVGNSEASLYTLGEAARAPGADARTRQNLALALALSGRWAQARILAAQDLSLDKVEGRMAEWTKLAEQPNPGVRIATLIGTSMRADGGMPARLALQASTDTRMAAADVAAPMAAADPAPVERFAPPPPVVADAGEAIRAVELPMPARDAHGVVPVSDLPAPPKADAPVILADAAPYRHAPRVDGERLRPMQREALDIATRIVPRAMGFDSKKPSGWAVQLGAYDSLAIAQEKWGVLKRRNTMLGQFPASSHSAVVKGRTFHRLTVNGLASRGDATELCRQLKAQGQQCFIRQMGGSESIQWAAKASPVRMASR